MRQPAGMKEKSCKRPMIDISYMFPFGDGSCIIYYLYTWAMGAFRGAKSMEPWPGIFDVPSIHTMSSEPIRGPYYRPSKIRM